MRWNRKVAEESVALLRMNARVGSRADHTSPHSFYVPGCYKNGFLWRNFGNGAWTQSEIANTCPHAYFVEMGRNPSGGKEAFSSIHLTSAKGIGMRTPKHGTKGFSGDGAMSDTVHAVARANGMKGEIRSIAAIAIAL